MAPLQAGIAENDLDRKVNDIIRYLKKGHNCQLSVTSNGFNTKNDPNGVMNLIQGVLDQVKDVGVCEKGVKTNESGNRATLMLQPDLKR